MAQVTFGTILRDARERKGYDLSTAARRLRIRPDILRAIEEDDFSRMPPRGYTRNMVNAYARLVGLNPTEITRMYLDEAYAYQVGRARSDERPSTSEAGRSSRGRRTRNAGQERSDERPPRQNAFGRTLYDDRADYRHTDYGTAPSLGQRRGADRTHPSRHAALPGTQYTNFYAGPKAPSAVQSRLPFIIAGAVIIVLLIVVLALVFGNKGGDAEEDAPMMQISGMPDSTQAQDGDGDGGAQQPAAPVATAPTSVEVSYSVASGDEAYVEISVDGGTAEPKQLTGPVDETVEVTGTWKLSTWRPDSVKVLVDGKQVEFDVVGDGATMPSVTVDFNEVLLKWHEEHPGGVTAGSGASNAAGSAGSGSSSGTAASAGSGNAAANTTAS